YASPASPSPSALRGLMQSGARHYSDRYACSYLQSDAYTVWYLSERGLAARRQLAAFFGADTIVLSAPDGVWSE
ncbi:MAG: hypothetical protein IKN53_05045, partial [Oscillibacter sp.]|nr:hypothetical protein [Oscillibacter sp.]